MTPARLSSLVLALVATATCFAPPARGDEAPRPVVRLAVVNTPHQSGLLAALLPGFEKACGCRVEVYSGSDVYARADRGEADIVISHYGKGPVEAFVTSGRGLWPRTVFSNQAVLVGPKEDPAGVRGLTDPFEAMRRIAASGAPFVVSASDGAHYLAEVLTAGAGLERGDWWEETREEKGRAILFARERGGYTLWGSFPFERFSRKRDTGMEVMVWDTPLFHRVMASVVVNPERFPGVNVEGAKALEAWLLSPGVQAAVARYREPGLDRQTWWPAARDNNPGELLGMGRRDDAED